MPAEVSSRAWWRTLINGFMRAGKFETLIGSAPDGLIQTNGTPRPAMTWLMNYLGR
jgi:hypothetical protein